jgi:DNA ligase-associated metallophosphoesterase
MTRSFSFGQQTFEVAGDAALYWPEQRALLVADLHLEKASSYASGGQMLPPYDSLSTLKELEALTALFDVRAIICLGDNFHDAGGEARLGGDAAALLRHLTTHFRWTWITGNHDPHVAARWGGQTVEEVVASGIVLRHEASPIDTAPEISGHFHPKYRALMRKRMVSRRCFVQTANKIIMPAFGALTGGMDAGNAAIRRACGLAKHGRMAALVPVKDGLAKFALVA